MSRVARIKNSRLRRLERLEKSLPIHLHFVRPHPSDLLKFVIAVRRESGDQPERAVVADAVGWQLLLASDIGARAAQSLESRERLRVDLLLDELRFIRL